MRLVKLAIMISLFGLGIVNAEEQAADMGDLTKIKAAFKETWVNPDVDFTRFNKLFLWESRFEYRDVGPAKKTQSTMMSSRNREFGISDTDRQKFEEIVKEAFVKGVQRAKKVELSNAIGPNTLIMRAAVLDIISLVPPETIGRSDVYLSSVGEATLVLELLDADTGDVVAVVSERRAMGRTGGMDSMTMPTNSATILSEIRRWAQSAGSKLGSELDKAISGK